MIDKIEEIPGTAVDVLDVTVSNTTENFRANQLPSLGWPSLWRLAKLVTFERGPLGVYTTNVTPGEDGT